MEGGCGCDSFCILQPIGIGAVLGVSCPCISVIPSLQSSQRFSKPCTMKSCTVPLAWSGFLASTKMTAAMEKNKLWSIDSLQKSQKVTREAPLARDSAVCRSGRGALEAGVICSVFTDYRLSYLFLFFVMVFPEIWGYAY